MRRFFALLVFLFYGAAFGQDVTSTFTEPIRNANDQRVAGLDVDLYQGGQKKYDLTENPSYPGLYENTSVATGEYDVYIGGSLFKSGIFFSSNKVALVTNLFNSTMDTLTFAGGHVKAGSFEGDGSLLTNLPGGGGGEANTGANLGTGLPVYHSKSGVALRFLSFESEDFDTLNNKIEIDGTKWAELADLPPNLVAAPFVTATASAALTNETVVGAGTDITADLEEEAHATEHQDGGADEISVTGLSGLLADGQKITVKEDDQAPSSLVKVISFNPTQVTITGDTAFVDIAGGGGGETNTASNLGGGLANFDSKAGSDLRFNSFNSADYDLAANVLSIKDSKWAKDSELPTEMANEPLVTWQATANLNNEQVVGAGTDITADLEEETHATEHQNGGADQINVAGLSGELADAQPITMRKNTGANVGTRSRINLIEGTNITLTVSDDAGSDELDVTIDASASGVDNTASNLGGGLANYSTKVGADLRFNSFWNNDFDLGTAGANLVSIDATKWAELADLSQAGDYLAKVDTDINFDPSQIDGWSMFDGTGASYTWTANLLSGDFTLGFGASLLSIGGADQLFDNGKGVKFETNLGADDNTYIARQGDNDLQINVAGGGALEIITSEGVVDVRDGVGVQFRLDTGSGSLSFLKVPVAIGKQSVSAGIELDLVGDMDLTGTLDAGTDVKIGGQSVVNAVANTGGGQSVWNSLAGNLITFNTFHSSDFQTASNRLEIVDSKWAKDSELATAGAYLDKAGTALSLDVTEMFNTENIGSGNVLPYWTFASSGGVGFVRMKWVDSTMVWDRGRHYFEHGLGLGHTDALGTWKFDVVGNGRFRKFDSSNLTMEFISDNADSVGQDWRFYHDSTTPENLDEIIRLSFEANDSAETRVRFADIAVTVLDSMAREHNGAMHFSVSRDSVDSELLTLRGKNGVDSTTAVVVNHAQTVNDFYVLSAVDSVLRVWGDDGGFGVGTMANPVGKMQVKGDSTETTIVLQTNALAPVSGRDLGSVGAWHPMANAEVASIIFEADATWNDAPDYSSKITFRTTNQDNPPATVMTMASDGVITGTFGTYHQASDRQLKKNIRPLRNALGMVNAMRGVSFDWKSEQHEQGRQTGMIAQELEKVLKSAVHTNAEGTKAIEYEELVGVLVAAINELSEKVERLEKQVQQRRK